MEIPHKTVLTVDEVAQLKAVTRAAVYTAIAQRRLAHVRVLNRIGIRKRDATAWQPMKWSGRPKGIPMSADAKQRISASQKRRWSQHKRSRS